MNCLRHWAEGLGLITGSPSESGYILLYVPEGPSHIMREETMWGEAASKGANPATHRMGFFWLDSNPPQAPSKALAGSSVPLFS